MIVGPALVVDLSYSLHHSAPNAAEFCGGYFSARVFLSQRGQALSFINLICHVIAIVALFGLLDNLTGTFVTHNLTRQLTGFAIPLQTDYRLGILRGTGPISHPILFGIACSIGALLAVALPIRAKGLTVFACLLGVLSSLSSAPIQGAVLGLCLLGYDSIFARFRRRWLVLISFGALVFGAPYAFNFSMLDFLNGHLDLDPMSYWTRVYQWKTVGAVVLNSPWIGIAFRWGDMVKNQELQFFAFASINSLWLYLALVYGIPGAILVGLSLIVASCSPGRGRGANLTMTEGKLASALSVVIAVIVLLGFTVDLWEADWILIALLVGVRAHLADLALYSSSTLKEADKAAGPRLASSPSIFRWQTSVG